MFKVLLLLGLVGISWCASYGQLQEEEPPANSNYSFEYRVNVPKSGDVHTRREAKDGPSTYGEYTQEDRDGSSRRIQYSVGARLRRQREDPTLDQLLSHTEFGRALSSQRRQYSPVQHNSIEQQAELGLATPAEPSTTLFQFVFNGADIFSKVVHPTKGDID